MSPREGGTSRDDRAVHTSLRQGIEGIALVAALTGVFALLSWVLAVVIAWVY